MYLRICKAVVVAALPIFLVISVMPLLEEVEIIERKFEVSAHEIQSNFVPDRTIHLEEVIIEIPKLTASAGVFHGVSGKETWYNLPMSGVIQHMRSLGYSEEEYPYWIRDDGCKMLGDYIMIAANLELRPKGTIVETSLGLGIVCDTGGFAVHNPTMIDIATNW